MIPVHLFGDVCDVPALRLAAPGIPLVEDAAQAIGARSREAGPDQIGSPAGGLGELACFSFFPTKNLGALGDGGLVTTHDEALAARVRQLRVHGAQEKYLHATVGGNFRLDALQASFLRIKLRQLEKYTQARRANALFYDDAFQSEGLDTEPLEAGGLVLPQRSPGHVYNQYVVRCQQRDGLKAHLDSKGIGNAIYYPRPLHRQECFAGLKRPEGSFPNAEQACRQVLALPISPELTAPQRDQVVEAVTSYLRPT